MKKLARNSLLTAVALVGLGFFIAHCASSSTTPTASASEVAVTAVSGSINVGDTSVGRIDPRPAYHDGFEWITSAYADNTWSCTAPTIDEGSSAVTTYQGAGTYAYTPASCSVTYTGGKTASAVWSGGAWSLVYNSSCTQTGTLGDFKISKQADNCAITRTSPTSGMTRTLTGPDGNQYALTHNTNGNGTGFDTSIATANTGVVVSCTSGGSPCTGGTMTVNGSHLTGTYNGKSFWDHTVTTGTTSGNSPLTISVDGSGNKTLSGSITVQHNLLKTVSTSTFSSVTYGKTGCCFPDSGTITTSYTGGSLNGATETLTFDGSSCGVGTLVDANQTSSTLTLIHCL